MKKLIFATNNAHKVSEFRSCFEQMGVEAEILTLKGVGFQGDIVEDADTFDGNAYIKAHTLCEFSGLISVADDSGLVVDALDGAPGVYSARYAGENATDPDNRNKLFKEMPINLTDSPLKLFSMVSIFSFIISLNTTLAFSELLNVFEIVSVKFLATKWMNGLA